jgi:hypothetical protein
VHIDSLAAEDGTRGPLCKLSFPDRVDRSRGPPLIDKVDRHIKRRSQTRRETPKTTLDPVLNSIIQRADSASDGDHTGHDIVDLPAVHICDGDDTLFEGINISCDDSLNGIDKLSGSDGGVAEDVRQRRVPSLALDNKVESVETSHHRTGLNGDVPLIEPWPVVNGVDRIYGELLE